MLILESRKTKFAVRRRRMCDCCKQRDTTYEVTSSFYDEAMSNQEIVSKMKALISGDAILLSPPLQQEFKCTKCHFNNRTSCSFQLPEYNTQEAFDCIHFALPYAN